jgi:hypothetical protein
MTLVEVSGQYVNCHPIAPVSYMCDRRGPIVPPRLHAKGPHAALEARRERLFAIFGDAVDVF